jgi:hypothetical protein
MKLKILGQLRAPDAKCVAQVAMRIRKEYEARFASLENGQVNTVAPVLRIGGSIGTFGADAIENVEVKNGTAECDVVVVPRNWKEMHADEIHALLKPRLQEAFCLLLKQAGIDIAPDWTIRKATQNEALHAIACSARKTCVRTFGVRK